MIVTDHGKPAVSLIPVRETGEDVAPGLRDLIRLGNVRQAAGHLGYDLLPEPA